MVKEKLQEEVAEQEELLFDDGPPMKKIAEWKSLYGDIYMTEVDTDIFIWRPITRTEYKEILKVKNADALYREERMCDKCVLWPEDYNFLVMGSGKAGIPSLLSEQIIEKSGFVASDTSKKL